MVAKNRVVPLLQRPMLPEIDTLIRWLVFALVFFLFIWPSYGEWKMGGVPNLAPPRLLKISLFFVFLYAYITNQFSFSLLRGKIQRHWFFFLCVMLYEFFRLVSIFMDENAGILFYAYLKETLFTNYFMFFALLAVLNGKQDVSVLLKLMLCGALAVSAFVVVEYALKTNIFYYIVSDANASSSFAFHDKTRDMSYRANGIFEHPLVLANFAVIMLPLVFSGMRKDQCHSVLWRFIAIVSLIGLFFCALFSSSRSGLAMFIASLAICFLYFMVVWFRSQRDYVLKVFLLSVCALLVVCCLSIFVYGDFQVFFNSSHEEVMSSHNRLQSFYYGIPAVLQTPLFGAGVTKVAYEVAMHGTYGKAIDSYFLLLAANSGIFALSFFLLLFIYPIVGCLRKGIITEQDKLFYFAMLLSFVFFFMFLLFVHALQSVMAYFYVLLACYISYETTPLSGNRNFLT